MDFYNPTPPTNNSNKIYIVILIVVLVSMGLVIYFTYDDIMTLFEKSKSSPSSPSSALKTNNVTQTSASVPAASASLEGSPSPEGSVSSAPVSSAPAASAPAASSSPEGSASPEASVPVVDNDLPFQTNGTKNIGETCETDGDCKSSLDFPLVCNEAEANGVKTCRKPSIADGGVSSCYRYQCNVYLKDNITRQFNFNSNGRENHAHACHKCDYRRIHSGNKYELSGEQGRTHNFPKIEGSNRTDYKALYNAMCYKNANGACDPSADDINRLTGVRESPSV